MKLKKFAKYGDLNTHDLFKFFAISFMIIDHISHYFWNLTWLRLIGRLSFPIFATIYGYYFDNKVDKKLWYWGTPLILVDLIVKKSIFPLNILFSFIMGGTLMKLYNENKYKLKEWDKKIIFSALFILHFFLAAFFQYGSFIIWFMLCGSLFKQATNENRNIITLGIFWYYLADQSIKFHFNVFYIILFALSLFVIYLRLKDYKLEKYTKITNPILKNVIMFMGRYSMEIYTIHLAIFKFLRFWIFGKN